tara:strand:+ start:33 stop:548 length:516 start_codon:yes stop_codon:yes gene_type:complete
MKKILIISATSGNNLILSKKIEKICSTFNVNSELINLETYNIPLYTPIEQKKIIPKEVQLILKKFINAQGFIFCAPEYNGSIPPILTSMIAWLSVVTKEWRLVFNDKVALIATHSGGGGNNFTQSLKIQLNHLGTIVLPRTIVVNSYTEFDEKKSNIKIELFINLVEKLKK